jgi:hypothetical protein
VAEVAGRCAARDEAQRRAVAHRTGRTRRSAAVLRISGGRSIEAPSSARALQAGAWRRATRRVNRVPARARRRLGVGVPPGARGSSTGSLH